MNTIEQFIQEKIDGGEKDRILRVLQSCLTQAREERDDELVLIFHHYLQWVENMQ